MDVVIIFPWIQNAIITLWRLFVHRVVDEFVHKWDCMLNIFTCTRCYTKNQDLPVTSFWGMWIIITGQCKLDDVLVIKTLKLCFANSFSSFHYGKLKYDIGREFQKRLVSEWMSQWQEVDHLWALERKDFHTRLQGVCPHHSIKIYLFMKKSQYPPLADHFNAFTQSIGPPQQALHIYCIGFQRGLPTWRRSFTECTRPLQVTRWPSYDKRKSLIPECNYFYSAHFHHNGLSHWWQLCHRLKIRGPTVRWIVSKQGVREK